MALARTLGVAVIGVAGQLIEIEADLSAGLPGWSFTGLADTSVVEARDRIRAAIVNSGLAWPNRKITIALLPADVRKVGSRFDLAMALAVLASAGEISPSAVADSVWIAELGLDGRLRPVHGVLPSVLTAQRAGVRRVLVAAANGAEAALVDGMDVRIAHDLREIVAWLRAEGAAPTQAVAEEGAAPAAGGCDLADVAGQSAAKRALEIAAAGGHHLSLVGAPGAGKTMLAERLPGLLPLLDDAAALEVTAVHSVAGRLTQQARLVRLPPMQAPHHTASVAALVGGGSHLARPGAISLAHHGVLFLDEASNVALCGYVSEDAQPDAAIVQVVGERQHFLDRAVEPIELPHAQRVPVAQVVQSGKQPRPVLGPALDLVLEHADTVDLGERVALQSGVLRDRRNPGVPHGARRSRLGHDRDRFTAHLRKASARARL